MTSHAIARRANNWRPAWDAIDRTARKLEVGMVVAWEWAAWEVTHVSPKVEPDENGRDTRATLHRLHGPKHERENDRGDMAVAFNSRWSGFDCYRGGRVYLCSCCGDPAPCRMQVAEEASALAAKRFDERLARMGPGICYGCGEVITQRQERITYPGDHADFPGRSGPTFHTRQKCYDERRAYAGRAGLHVDGGPLPPRCPGTFVRHGDGTFECSGDCEGPRAEHAHLISCSYAGCEDPGCNGNRSCTPDGTETRR